MKKTTVLQQLLINTILPLVLFILLYCGYNYFTEQKRQTAATEAQINQITQQVKNLVDLYDLGMITHEDAFNEQMKDLSYKIYDLENISSTNLSKVDLYDLSIKLGMDTLKESIYIIDRNCIICNTTFYKDKNLDFKKIDPKYTVIFNDLRDKKKFSADRFGLEMSTGKIKKYSFLPSRSGEYIIELGFYSDKATELKKTLIEKVQSSAKNYSSLSKINFDAVVKDSRSFTFAEKYQAIINKASREKRDQKIVEVNNGLEITNHFIYLPIANAGLYNCYIVQIETNNALQRALLRQELIRFVKIILLLILPLIILVYYRAKTIIEPLKKLSAKTNQIRIGNLNERAEVTGATEIAELSENFNHMVTELQKSYEDLEQKVKDRTKEIQFQKHIIEEKQKEILDSINYAKRIQYTLLANKEFLKEQIKDHFVFFDPKDIVSGDFYWATKQDDKFYLAVCDSTGHGVPGAFMSLLNIGYLKEAINEKFIYKPNEVLNFVRQRLIDNISKEGQKDGFDGILICVDQKTKKLSYSAANNSPVLVSNKNYTELDADRMPVGKGEKEDLFTLREIDYKPGDTLYLYTDGYADQFGGPKGKKFKYKPLNELLVKISSEEPEIQEALLKNNFDEWRGDLEQVDDVLIIGIKL